MPFTGKNWVDEANHAGPPAAPPGTPVSAVGLEDLETRLTDYTDLKTVVSVKEPPYSAVGDGVTNDREAVQDAIDAVAAETNGGVIWFPPGDYLIGTPGLSLPTSNQKPIGLWGSGSATNAVATRLVRNGAYVLLTSAGTGTTGATISHDLHVRDLTFNGASQAATLVRLDRCAGHLFENVRIQASGQKALYASQLWNSRFLNCFFETSGSSTAHAAVLLDGYATPGETNTNWFIGCHWEGNAYHDLELDGTNAASRCTGVHVVGSKFEGITDGVCIHFKQAHYCTIASGHLASNAGSDEAVIYHGAGILNNLTGLVMIGSSSSAYVLQLAGGGPVSVTGCSFIGGTTAHVRMDSGMGDVQMDACGHYTLTSEVDISDARTTKTGLLTTTGSRPQVIDARTYGATVNTDAEACSIATISVTDANNFTIAAPLRPTVGQVLTYDIYNSTGGAIGTITWNAVFKLAGAFTNPASAKHRTITFYYDGTNWIEVNRAAADI